MDIKTGFVSRLYDTAKTALQPASDGPAQQAAQAVNSFADTLKQAETTSRSAMVGEADPHALVDALAQSQLAVETAVSVRNKVVEAYQEILRMPV